MDTSDVYIGYLCRTCMIKLEGSTEPQHKSIFETIDECDELRIADLLSSTIPQILEVQLSDELPKKMCCKCLHQLISVYRFQKLCVQSDHKMREMVSKKWDGLDMSMMEAAIEDEVLPNDTDSYPLSSCQPKCTGENSLLPETETELEGRQQAIESESAQWSTAEHLLKKEQLLDYCENSQGELSEFIKNEPIEDDEGNTEYSDTIHSTTFLKKEFTTEEQKVTAPMAEDEKLLNLLKDWTLESIFPILKQSGVGADELQYLTETDLKKIFPDLKNLGIKAKFRSKLLNLKYNANTLQPPIAQSDIFHIEELQSILEATPIGRDALEYYTHNSTLTPQHQQAIVNCVVDYFILKGHTLQVKDMQSIAECICKRFCGELTATYFYRREKRASGKLYDRYCNVRKKRRLSLTQSYASTVVDSDSFCENVFDEIEDNVSETYKTWLKYNESPLEEVEEKWKRTFAARRKSVLNLSITDMISEWPLYKSSILGPKLIQSDFTTLYNEISASVFVMWEKFIPHIIKLYRDDIKDKASKEILSKIDYKSINTDSRNCIIALLLNAVITPTAKYKFNGKLKKVTINEAMECFILYIKSASILEEEIICMRQRFEQQNVTLQPVIVVVGDSIVNLSDFYIYCDGFKFKLSSFVKCLDVCFQIFHVFNIPYPVYCKGVWNFIQHFFYNIYTSHDEKSSKITGLISHLTALLKDN
ncbi:uncharacterized protein [Eurosta solidaginis]